MTVDMPALALALHDADRSVAIATVVETWDSAPRPVGSQMVIASDGAMEGSVSGGCVEGAVVAEALEALETGQVRLLNYGVSDDDAFAVGLACGGKIRVLVEPVAPVMPVDLLRDLVERRAGRVPVAYVADLNGTARHLVGPDAFVDRFAQDRSGIEDDGDTFVGVHNPCLRMVIVGAVHIAQPLLMMAQACGYEVIVVDPRDAFATFARFPEAQIVTEWPDEALGQIGLDARTCVVTLSHDPKLDDPAIMAALRSEVFYIGALGSTRTHEKRIARLMSMGFSKDAIARVHGPVGLPLGGRHPAEIAVSIMAQVTQLRVLT